MELGNSIKSIRKAKLLSQGDLAALCGITQAYLSQIENDRKEPTLSTLKLISDNLQTPLPILFFNALEDCDVPESKKEIFHAINPSIKSLLDTFI